MSDQRKVSPVRQKLFPSDVRYAGEFVRIEFDLALRESKKAIQQPVKVLKGIKSCCRALAQTDLADPGYDQMLSDVAVSALVGLASRHALRMTPSPILRKDVKA